MMSHQPYRDWILASADERLGPEARGELEAHLASCPSCRALLESAARLEELLAAAGADLRSPEPGFMLRFEARRTRQISRARWLGGGLVLGLAAAVSLGSTALGLIQLYAQVENPAALSALLVAVSAFAATFETIADACLLAAQSLLAGSTGQTILMATAVLGLAAAAVWVHLLHRLTLETAP